MCIGQAKKKKRWERERKMGKRKKKEREKKMSWTNNLTHARWLYDWLYERWTRFFRRWNKISFLGGFCFHHLAAAATASASAGLYSAWAFGIFDFHLTVWAFGSLGVSNESKAKGEAGRYRASLGFGHFTAVCYYCYYCHCCPIFLHTTCWYCSLLFSAVYLILPLWFTRNC